MIDTPVPIAFPEAFDVPWFWLFETQLSRQEFIVALGEPHSTRTEEGTGDADWWGYVWPCGLRVLFSVNHDNDLGAVHAGMPEPPHVRRHPLLPAGALIEVPSKLNLGEHEFLIATYSGKTPELQRLHSCQLWRMGDDGNAVPVGRPTSESDAACWKRQLEATGHKQIYWTESVTGSQQGFDRG